MTNPAVADAIMANGTLTHYDRPRMAQLCEKAALYMRALQHYTDLPDIKRVIINTHAIDPQQLVEYFGSLSADWAIDCLRVSPSPTCDTQSHHAAGLVRKMSGSTRANPSTAQGQGITMTSLGSSYSACPDMASS